MPGPGDPDASGSASITLNQGLGTVCFDVSWANVDGTVFASHVHVGTADVAGPIVVTLFTGWFDGTGAVSGCAEDVGRETPCPSTPAGTRTGRPSAGLRRQFRLPAPDPSAPASRPSPRARPARASAGARRRIPEGTETEDRLVITGSVPSGLRLIGGSIHALRSRLSLAATYGPVDRWLSQRTDDHRSRGGGPSPPVDGPQAPGGEAASTPSRPIVHGRDQREAPSGSVVLVRGQPPDGPSLAPGAGAKEVDLPADLRGRQAAHHR